MKKDFDSWNKKKKRVHTEKERPFFHEREVWFAHLGANVGFEQDGVGGEFLRPVVVLKKFNNEVCWVVPLSQTQKRGKYYFTVSIDGGDESQAILSQIRLLDGKRMKYLAGYITKDELEQLKTKIRRLLA